MPPQELENLFLVAGKSGQGVGKSRFEEAACFVETFFERINQLAGFIHVDVKILGQNLIILFFELDGPVDQGDHLFPGRGSPFEKRDHFIQLPMDHPEDGPTGPHLAVFGTGDIQVVEHIVMNRVQTLLQISQYLLPGVFAFRLVVDGLK